MILLFYLEFKQAYKLKQFVVRRQVSCEEYIFFFIQTVKCTRHGRTDQSVEEK